MRYLENELYLSDIRDTIGHTRNFDYFCGKKVLVLGATGLIGSFLVDCLTYAETERNLGLHVMAAGRSHERLKERFGEETDRLHFLESDVTQLDPDIPADVIIHAASPANPRMFREKPVETMLANMLGTYRALETARKNAGCRFLYISSGEVQEEINHLSTRACYPVSKKAGETLCLSYLQEYQVDVVLSRPCHTFGANSTGEDNRATAQFIGCASSGRDIVMNSAGEQVRSFAYVADCVSGLLTVLTSGEAGEVYGIATDETCSIRQFAEKCAETAGRKVIVRNPNEAERAEASPIKGQVVDNVKLKELGWKPAFSIEQGIRQSIIIQKDIGGV